MKDLNDKLKGNLITKRGPGRPAKGKALTPAQKQKAYRERQKELNRDYFNLKIHRDERELLIELVNKCYMELIEQGDRIGSLYVGNLGRRLEELMN